MSNVDFGVEYRRGNKYWIDSGEYFDLYEDALDHALEIQRQDDECRIIRYKSLSEEPGHHKSKIVAVFQPMPRH